MPEIPVGKMPVVCCRVGDPEWAENSHSKVSFCAACLFPIHITNATQERVNAAPNAFIICVQCAATHFEQTGIKFAPLKPDEQQLAEGHAWSSNLTHAICQLWYESERGWGQRPDGFSLHI